ncbi:putative ankyrin repeat protein R848 [Phytophthora ramorum]|uniref:putative ankyrin repeat protein R848 n=1 Tax=Phytophthora ramorum TaxID=164328 RepID=UPI0030A9BE9A|nr:putative ankyrin repeat protein R848 [Phytophthora ramorum]
MRSRRRVELNLIARRSSSSTEESRKADVSLITCARDEKLDLERCSHLLFLAQNGSNQTPLLLVTLLLRSKPELSPLTHVIEATSVYLDSSVELPLHKACTFGSLALLDRIWTSSVDLESNQNPTWSVRNLLRTEKPHYHEYQFSKCLVEAVKLKNVAIVKWLFEHFPNIPVRHEVVGEATAAGAQDILRYFLANEEVFDTAEWPREVAWGGIDAARAAEAGHREVVQWLYSEIDTERDDDAVTCQAIANGDMELVAWIGEDIPDGRCFAAANGHFEMVKSFFDKPANGEGLLLKATENGHLEIARWIIERDLDGTSLSYEEDFRPPRITSLGGEASLAVHVAAVNGHLEVAQYLHEHVDTAVRDIGDREETRQRKQTLMALSIHFGDKHQAHQVSSKTMLHAAKNGLLGVAKWLYSSFGSDPSVNLFQEVKRRE